MVHVASKEMKAQKVKSELVLLLKNAANAAFFIVPLYSLKNESSFFASIASISSIISWLRSLALLIGLEILLFSNDHSPKSISWQRFEQNGRCGLCSDHSTLALHVGQFTTVGMISLSNKHFCQILLNSWLIIQSRICIRNSLLGLFLPVK